MYKLTSVLLALSVTSCAINPYTEEEKVSNTAKGAAIGTAALSAVGAGIGALIDGGNGARLGASIGAGVGLLTGAGTGVYMDKQERVLRERLLATGVSIKRTGDNLSLIMPSDITFKLGSVNLNPKSITILNSVGAVLTECDKTRVEVHGHTDSLGSEQFNRMLSQVRADNVVKKLSLSGVSSERLFTQAHGEINPVANNKTNSGRALNRRVVISIN